MLKNSEQQQKVVVAAVFLILLGGAFYGYFYVLEWKEKEINRGYSLEAQKNASLAMQLYLKSQSIESERAIQFSLLDDLLVDDPSSGFEEEKKLSVNDVLLLIHARGLINGRRFENLWRWVEEGGTLITSLDNPYIGRLIEEDDLFYTLGIIVKAPELDGRNIFDVNEALTDEEGIDETEEQGDAENEAPDAEDQALDNKQDILPRGGMLDKEICTSRTPTEITLPAEESPLSVSYNSDKYFYNYAYEPEWLVNAQDSEQLISAYFRVGAGHIYVVRDTNIWHNRNIQCFDNAYFLWTMVNKAKKVWLLENKDAPSLFALAYQSVPYAVCVSMLAVIFFLWRALTRFGPVFVSEETHRRSFSEHLKASARFLYKHKQHLILVEELRKTIEQLMSKKVLDFDSLNKQEKIDHIAKLAALEHEEIYRAMFKTPIESHQAFVEIVNRLKIIKDQL